MGCIANPHWIENKCGSGTDTCSWDMTPDWCQNDVNYSIEAKHLREYT